MVSKKAKESTSKGEHPRDGPTCPAGRRGRKRKLMAAGARRLDNSDPHPVAKGRKKGHSGGRIGTRLALSCVIYMEKQDPANPYKEKLGAFTHRE